MKALKDTLNTIAVGGVGVGGVEIVDSLPNIPTAIDYKLILQAIIAICTLIATFKKAKPINEQDVVKKENRKIWSRFKK